MQTKPTRQFTTDADALFAESTKRMLAWANARLDSRISRTTYGSPPPRPIDDGGEVIDTPSTDTADETKPEE